MSFDFYGDVPPSRPTRAQNAARTPTAAGDASFRAGTFLRRFRARERPLEIWREGDPGGASSLLCQVSGAAVVTLESDGIVRTGRSLGGDEWQFDGVPPGTYTLRVRTLDGDLLVPGLAAE